MVDVCSSNSAQYLLHAFSCHIILTFTFIDLADVFSRATHRSAFVQHKLFFLSRDALHSLAFLFIFMTFPCVLVTFECLTARLSVYLANIQSGGLLTFAFPRVLKARFTSAQSNPLYLFISPCVFLCYCLGLLLSQSSGG